MACGDRALPHPLDIAFVNSNGEAGQVRWCGTVRAIVRCVPLPDAFRQVPETRSSTRAVTSGSDSRRATMSEPEHTAPTFVPVRIASTASACRGHLPNGVVWRDPRAH